MRIKITVTDSILFLDLLQWLLLLLSGGSARLDERQSHLKSIASSVWQTTMEQESALIRWLLRLTVLEVIPLQVVLPSNGSALFAELMHLPILKRKLCLKIEISCSLIGLGAGGMDLLRLRIVEGELAVAEWPMRPVLQGG